MSQYVQRHNYTFSGTEVLAEEYVHTWEISNFPSLKPGLGNGIASRGSLNDQDLWSMSLYAEGFDLNTKEYVGLEVSFAKHLVKIVRSPYLLVISFLDTRNKEFQVINDHNKKEKMFLPTLTKRNFLLDEKNNLLHNGTLIIKLKIYFNDDTAFNPKSTVQISSKADAKRMRLDNMLNELKFSDLKIVAGDRVFWACKGLLANRSPVFAAMFEHDMMESNESKIVITDIDQEAVYEMLRFIYLGEVNIADDIVCDILAAADKYEIEDLKEMCEEAVIKHLNMNTVISYLNFAERYRADILKTSALEFFKSNAKALSKTEEFQRNAVYLAPLLGELI